MEDNFDNIARSALKDMEVPYQPADWQEMNKRLDQERKKGPLFLYKGIELSIIALVIWTLFQFAYKSGGSTESGTLPASPEPRTTPTQGNLVLPADTKKLEQPDNKGEGQQENLNPLETSPDEEAAKGKKTAARQPVANTGRTKTNVSAKKTSKQKSSQSATTSIYSENNNSTQRQTTGNKDANNGNQTSATDRPQGTNFIEEGTSTPFKLDKTALNATQAADRVAIPKVVKPAFFLNTLPSKSSLLERGNIDLGLDFLPVTFNTGDPLPKLQPNRYWHLRVFGSPDMNMKDGNYSLGASMGGLLGKDITKQILVESGLIYNHKQFTYLPGEIQPVAENPVQLTDILLSQVEIPLNLQFTIKKSTNWRPFAVVGMSANFILYSDYDYSLTLNGSNEGVEWQHQYPEKGKGLIHGGEFKSNNYYTVNFGIGLERQLDNNLHLFVQPTYKYALNGMGLDESKLNTFSLIMGVRARLKK